MSATIESSDASRSALIGSQPPPSAAQVIQHSAAATLAYKMMNARLREQQRRRHHRQREKRPEGAARAAREMDRDGGGEQIEEHLRVRQQLELARVRFAVAAPALEQRAIDDVERDERGGERDRRQRREQPLPAQRLDEKAERDHGRRNDPTQPREPDLTEPQLLATTERRVHLNDIVRCESLSRRLRRISNP